MLFDDADVKINGKLMNGRIFASQYVYANETQPVWVAVSPSLIEKYYKLFDKRKFQYLGSADPVFGRFVPECKVNISISDKDVTLLVTDCKTGEKILSCVEVLGDTHA